MFKLPVLVVSSTVWKPGDRCDRCRSRLIFVHGEAVCLACGHRPGEVTVKPQKIIKKTKA